VHAVSMKAVLDCVAQPVCVVDRDGRFCYANPAALAALGYEHPAELEGRPSDETFRDGDAWFVRRDGSTFPVSYRTSPVDLADGTGTVVAFTDLEEQHRAEAILAQVAQPVWVVDHDGRFHYANPAALAALGYDDLSELKGKPGHETVHYKYPDGSPFPEEECAVTRARLAGERTQELQDWLVRKDGSILWISYSTAPFETPQGRGSVTAFTDIEEQRRMEQAARERDVAEARAAELRAARRRIIEAADAARAQLTRDLHDGAQQQLVGAAINLQLAERKAAADPERAGELRATALEQTKAGITELRELAAGIHPGILTDRGLGPAVEALASRLPLPVSVVRTPDRRLPAPVEASVYFLVSEALTNAVKHARAGEATVDISAGDGHLTVEVSDDGIGGARATPGGSGLAGLADRVAALDGELTVASEPSQGTTLRADIPLG
jgi:PAS domain S-box-containing protein